jgi:hypothetical protein
MKKSYVEEIRLHFYIACSLIVISKNGHQPTNTCLLYTGQFKKKVTQWRLHSKRRSGTPFAVESPFCNTVFPGGGGPKHFPASITNKL